MPGSSRRRKARPLGQVPLEDGAKAFLGPGRLLSQAEEALQRRREEEANRRPQEDGGQAHRGVQQASQKGRDQRSQGGNLVDQGVAPEQLGLLHHLGDAGLDGGRLKGAQDGENHQQRPGEEDPVAQGEKGHGPQHRQPREGVQGHHDVPPVGPVCQHAAQRGE